MVSSFDPSLLDQYSTEPGVYLMKDRKGGVLYVGKASNLRQRLKHYFAPKRDERAMIPFLLAEIATIDVIVVFSEKEARLLENTLIKKHQPKFNVLLKDGKTFIRLMINHQHPWPKLTLVRSASTTSKQGLYFGPYTNAYAARQIYDLMSRLFPLRQCSDEELKRRTRPCLLYGMKRCLAPCVHLCSQEEYQTILRQAIQFLKGNNEMIIEELKIEMEKASESLEFEKAAHLLKLIKHIEHVTAADTIVAKETGKDIDALGLYRHGYHVVIAQLFFRQGKLIGSEHYAFSDVLETDEEVLSSFLMQYYQRPMPKPEIVVVPFPLAPELTEILNVEILAPQKGEKKTMILMAEKNAHALFEQEKKDQDLTEKALLDLQETLGLTRYPRRIECFDISHISGTDVVASMVAFTDGKYDKKRGRLFKIRSLNKNDDYGALHEALYRRLSRLQKENDLPDLVIVDGGKGQLTTALDTFTSLNIATVDLISITKEEGKHHRGLTQEKIFTPLLKTPLILPLHSPLLFLLQKIRDQAHRRAIGFHRQRRKKRLISSLIDEIPGIGPVKRKRLLQHFGSLQRVLAASPEELLSIQGVNSQDVEQINLFKYKK